MNYVDWIKEYKETAQYTDNLIQKYIKRKKEVHTQAELENLNLKIHNLCMIRDNCLGTAKALSEYKNSEAEEGE